MFALKDSRSAVAAATGEVRSSAGAGAAGWRSNSATTVSDASLSTGNSVSRIGGWTSAGSLAGPAGISARSASASASAWGSSAGTGVGCSASGSSTSATTGSGAVPASATTTGGGGAALRLTLTRSAARPTAARTPTVARTGREVSALSMCRTPCSMPAQVLARSSVRRCSTPESWTRSKSCWARARFAFRLSASGSGVASSNARFRSSSGSVIALFPLATWHAAVCGPPRAASSRCLRRHRAPRRLARGSFRRRS